MKSVLAIAGSDSSGGAGVQADLKTVAAHGMYGMSAITALTAQNTTGVTSIMEATPGFVRDEIDAVFTDIFPDAVKIGMVSNAQLIGAIADGLVHHGAHDIVVDPVMVATSGARLLSEDASSTLIDRLLPLASVITPNTPEAEVLSGIEISGHDDMVRAAHAIARLTPGAVLVKGGHLEDAAIDLLLVDGREVWLSAPRIETGDVHGTGCTLSSAIACNLAAGADVEQAVRNAKAYLTGALANGVHFGKGSGPVNHLWSLEGAWPREPLPPAPLPSKPGEDTALTSALIVGGSPRPIDPGFLAELVSRFDLVIAADSGFDKLRRIGIMPDLVVGDLDSISREGESFLLDSSIELVRVPSMKDFTDIQLALGTAAGRGAANVGLTGVSAGRIDHELGVLGACAGMGKLAPTIIEDDRRVAFLDAEGRAGLHLHELGASVGDEFSVIALSEDARVSESGVRYPLDEGRLSILDPRGVSNVVAEDDSAVSVSSGRVAVVFMPAHARG